MTLTSGSDYHRIERAGPEQLRFPLFVFVGGFADRSGEHAVFGDHHEQRQVDRINAFAQNAALAAALTASFQERDCILKVIRINVATQRLNRLQRNTVARISVSHLAFGYDHERFFMNAVLPRIQSEVNTAAQEAGLKPRLATAGNDPAFAQRTLA